MTRISDTDVANVLRSLLEDSGDDYGCFETIEPYVNANREFELDDAGILAVLHKMRAMGLVDSYRLSPDKNAYDLAGEASIDSEIWFRATQQGSSEYGTKYSAYTGS